MRGLRGLLFLALGILVPAQGALTTKAVVAAVARYVAQYQRDFIALVADEQTTQQVLDRGVVTAARETRGELFSTFLDGPNTWMSVHDVVEVDGVPVPHHDDVREMLRSESLQAVAPRVAAANARFNLGHVSRNFNEPTLALLFFTPARIGGVAFDQARVDASGPRAALVTLRLRDRDDASLVRSRAGRVTERGSIIVERDTGRVQHTLLTFSDGHVDATLETSYGLDDHVNLWVPVLFVERYSARDSHEVTAVRTELTNYRRFETTGRVIQ